MYDSQLNQWHHRLSLRTNSNTTMRVQLIQSDRNCVVFQMLGIDSTAAFVYVQESRKMQPKINYSKRLWFDRHNWTQHTDWRDRQVQHKLECPPYRCILCAAVGYLWHNIVSDAVVHWTAICFKSWEKKFSRKILIRSIIVWQRKVSPFVELAPLPCGTIEMHSISHSQQIYTVCMTQHFVLGNSMRIKLRDFHGINHRHMDSHCFYIEMRLLELKLGEGAQVIRFFIHRNRKK